MRIVLIILSLAALLFIWWLGTSALQRANPTTGNTPSATVSVASNPNQVDSLTLDVVKTNAKLEAKIEELNKKVDQLSGIAPVTPAASTASGSTGSGTATHSGDIIPISAKFLGKVLPTIEPVKVENHGIFDLRIFDQTAYTTYKDEKFGITIVASMLPYNAFLKNFQSVDKTVYTVNETKTFPFESFYVNPPHADASVRIVMKVEAQTLLISLPKSRFNTLKELILKA